MCCSGISAEFKPLTPETAGAEWEYTERIRNEGALWCAEESTIQTAETGVMSSLKIKLIVSERRAEVFKETLRRHSDSICIVLLFEMTKFMYYYYY